MATSAWQDEPVVTALDEIDLLDPANFRDGQPWELYRRLREADPVHWHPERRDGPGFWALTRHADVRSVSRDPATFSSWLGGTSIEDSTPERLAEFRMMMLTMDPPEHTGLRLMVNRSFTPRRVAQLRARIDELARQIVDAVLPRGECDFVADVAGELPSYLIAELVGIPLDDGRRLYELTEVMHSSSSWAEVDEAIREMFAYSQALIAEKRANPADDLASTLLHAEVDGRRLSDMEFNLFFLLLVNAGGDTTRNLVAGGMEVLFAHPDQLARLRADRTLLGPAIDEMLRFVSPVVHFRRTATRDTVVGGRAVAEGDKVVVFYGAANRDPEAFADPERFDITRSPNDHVAFGGGGAHHCLGAHLAKAEIAALFSEVLTRLADIAPAGPVERLNSTFIAGPKHMPVRFRPAAV
jgi:cytochrome P450